jgi:hypothetical protein
MLLRKSIGINWPDSGKKGISISLFYPNRQNNFFKYIKIKIETAEHFLEKYILEDDMPLNINKM